ncbi:hypothetical protein CHELA1G2_21788 [Hyphomicrobiales bacterium]|nr:hypothetical protein CHELA1G2_21788 [Hyphomicrobiales bacterium]
MRVACLRQQKCGGQIRVHDLAPVVKRIVLRCPANTHSGVVDENINAGMALVDFIDRSTAVFRLRDVSGNCVGMPTRRVELGDSSFILAAVTTNYRHMRAGTRQALGDAEPDATIAARDHSHAA